MGGGGGGGQDLGGGVNGLLCRWAGEPAVAATWEDAEHLLCRAPPLRAGASGSGFESRAVEVTLNRDVEGHSLTTDGVEFHYYSAASLSVTEVFPRGGPAGGGTLVTLTGSGFFADRGGVFCRFGGAEGGVVPATLLSAPPLRMRTSS